MNNQETQVSSHSATLAPIDSTWRKACTLESDSAVHNTAQSHLYSAYTAYYIPTHKDGLATILFCDVRNAVHRNAVK